MNCFVIMPFAKEFDDVYTVIKASVEGVIALDGGRCFRLDHTRPAGSITNRLLKEIQTADICVADVTGNVPNVMWEVGYAMALGKPIILITQKITELPFDIKDMQSLPYDRYELSRTLGQPLQKMIQDTLQIITSKPSESKSSQEQSEMVGKLLAELQELKGMVASVVKEWEPSATEQKTQLEDLSAFEGAWVIKESDTNLYVRTINGKLIAPYCYSGDDSLTAFFYNWQRIGEYWFVNFVWLSGDIYGFAFFKQETPDKLSGAWWSQENLNETPVAPPSQEGISMSWERKKNQTIPNWAKKFFKAVELHGYESFLPQMPKSK